MSWFDITIFDDFVPESCFDESVIPDSYEERASDHHEEVVSGVRSYHKKPVLPDLNEVRVNDDSYGIEYTGEPSYAKQSYTDNAYSLAKARRFEVLAEELERRRVLEAEVRRELEPERDMTSLPRVERFSSPFVIGVFIHGDPQTGWSLYYKFIQYHEFKGFHGYLSREVALNRSGRVIKIKRNDFTKLYATVITAGNRR